MFKILLAGVIFLSCGLIVMAAQTDWKTHRDPSGFALEIPQNWNVAGDGSGRISVSGDDLQKLVILPFKIENQINAQSAQSILLSIAKQISPRQKWAMPSGGWQFSTNGVRAIGTDNSLAHETAALWWANSEQGATGFYYQVAATPDSFESSVPIFSRILGSFRVTQTSNRTGVETMAQPLQFQQWVDPTESAFSMEVPRGWRIAGGIRRTSQTNSEIVMTSPDGQIMARIGDVQIITSYIEPNQTLMSLGYREGQLASNNAMIMRFMNGATFAKYYVQQSMSRYCRNLQLVSQKDRADYVRSLAARGLLASYSNYSAGEITYSCQMANGQNYLGYLLAETSVTPYQGVGTLWNVNRIQGFIAPPDQASVGNQALLHALSTTHMNPQWLLGEMKMNQQMAQDYQNYLSYSADLQKQTLNDRWESNDRIAEQRGDLLRGVTRVVDPNTGEAYKVQSSSNYYWIDPARNVITGTNQPYKPNWDFREMIETYK